jgi:ribonuclease G
MSEEILINITPMESRVALVENGVLQEVHVERTQKRGIVGNIYKGKVVRVLPGMQAAFVDIGLERAAFIHAAEISSREGSAVESISALVHEGQSLVVQVTKDPIGTKGARLTTQLSIPSRYLVYMPRTAHVGISLKIEDEAERERLKQVVADCVAAEGIEEAGGFILRTAADGARAEEILADIRYLRRLWEQIATQMKVGPTPLVIYEDLSLALRTLRDLSATSGCVSAIVVRPPRWWRVADVRRPSQPAGRRPAPARSAAGSRSRCRPRSDPPAGPWTRAIRRASAGRRSGTRP